MNAAAQIPPCPAGGQGVHRWLMDAAWACRKAGLTPDAAAQELEARMTRRPNSQNEIGDAVRKAFDAQRVIWHSKRNWETPTKWPAPNLEQLEAVAASGFGVCDLWERSPIRWDDNTPRTSELLGRLFGGDDPWVCFGSNSDFTTERLSKIIKPQQYPLIVPSPMLDKFGTTQDGRRSQHTLSNTGPRRFFVVEFDGISRDTQAAVLLHLSERAPLAMVVDSGGKSLHGWFFVAGKTDEQLRPFFQRVCALGADPAAIRNRSQFVRMPDGRRDNGNRQHVLFFNPERLTK